MVLIVWMLLGCNHTEVEETANKQIQIEVFNDFISYQYLYESSNVFSGLTIETYEIKYRVDGLMITGYIHKPLGPEEQYPAIIYCRGGNRDFESIDKNELGKQMDLAGYGFVVLSSQLRGNIFSQGRDEMGGADLNDILKLIEMANTLSFVKKGLLGYMAYQEEG